MKIVHTLTAPWLQIDTVMLLAKFLISPLRPATTQSQSTEAGALGVLKILNVDIPACKPAPVQTLVQLMAEPLVLDHLANHIQTRPAPVQMAPVIIQLAHFPSTEAGALGALKTILADILELKLALAPILVRPTVEPIVPDLLLNLIRTRLVMSL